MPIELEVMDHLRAAYGSETVSFRWQKGAYGRAPYRGAREILGNGGTGQSGAGVSAG